MAEEQESRTEAATPRRLQRAREEGNVPLSREAPTFAVLAGITLVLILTGPRGANELALRLRGFLSQLHGWDASADAGTALGLAMRILVQALAPYLLTAMLCGVAAVLLQTGFLLNPAALRPDLSRLDPRRGLKRLFGAEGLVETLKALIKVAVLTAAVWPLISADLQELASAPFWQPRMVLDRALRHVLHVLFVAVAAQAGLTVLDILWVRLRHARSLRMSRQDVRQEHRESEGDPRIKARVKQLRHSRARRRMLAAVPKAAVVVTNPTHYAVALAYDRAANAAPRVVAKGVDSMAARIREAAELNRVPLAANPPLARALYQVELDTDIPPQHYQAVAEIIAYVWRLKERIVGGP